MYYLIIASLELKEGIGRSMDVCENLNYKEQSLHVYQTFKFQKKEFEIKKHTVLMIEQQ